MIHKTIVAIIKYGVVFILLFVLLLVNKSWVSPFGFIGHLLYEMVAIFQKYEAQWMTVLCLVSYFVIFLILERRLLPLGNGLRLDNVNLWLAALVVFTLFRYWFAYQTASSSAEVSVFLGCIVFGKAISIWVRWRKEQIERRMTWLLGFLICLLACAALWQPEMAVAFQYHSITRWNGPWDNPNLYGLLMGVGFALAIGQTLETRNWITKDCGWEKVLFEILCLFAVVVTGYGLFKSYSRGAWLGTACGVAYLITKSQIIESSWFLFNQFFSRLKKNLLPLSVILASVFLLLFWQFRFSEWRPAQRAFSTANINDFSWRNRVMAWEGAIHMMADRPLVGFGFGQAESAYEKNYCPLDEPAAIETNDYFMLGISTGAPALLCFLAYLTLSFRTKSVKSNSPPSILHPSSSFSTICRSGSIVLLVGFWFDGGLFKLPVATVFWMLMELSRIEGPVENEVMSLTSKIGNQSETPYVVPYSKKEICLRRVAWVLAAAALLQTVVYLGTPFFLVSNETLAIARKCLIPPKEISDFEFLSANPVWRGKQLKILLEHVNLANYNRQLINWTLDDKMYREYVLMPTIQPERDGQLHWRRSLWEYFYPRIRKETDPGAAVQIVLQQLRQRITISVQAPSTIEEMWQRQTADSKGFEALCVAAFRSVGVPARLNPQQQAEFWDGSKWQTAPPPSVSSR